MNPGDWVSFPFTMRVPTWNKGEGKNANYRVVIAKGFGQIKRIYEIKADVECSCGGVREVKRKPLSELTPCDPPFAERKSYEASYD